MTDLGTKKHIYDNYNYNNYKTIYICMYVYIQYHIDTNNSVVTARGKGRLGGGESEQRRGNGDKKRL